MATFSLFILTGETNCDASRNVLLGKEGWTKVKGPGEEWVKGKVVVTDLLGFFVLFSFLGEIFSQ